MPATQYLLGMGSNRRHVRYGSPRNIIVHCFDILEQQGLSVKARSSAIETLPIGPSSRRYANAAVIVETAFTPAMLLAKLKSIESEFGDRRGQRWAQRTLDIDILLWTGGSYVGTNPDLFIPHPLMRERLFVLAPAAEIAADWRDPLTGLSVRQLMARKKARENAPKPLDPR